jgi:hypothetical protein
MDQPRLHAAPTKPFCPVFVAPARRKTTGRLSLMPSFEAQLTWLLDGGREVCFA